MSSLPDPKRYDPHGFFPSSVSPEAVAWLVMVALPFALLFLVLDKWQWDQSGPTAIMPMHSQSAPAPPYR